jgi:hypothetical protein
MAAGAELVGIHTKIIAIGKDWLRESFLLGRNPLLAPRRPAGAGFDRRPTLYDAVVEGAGFGDLFGDPEELQRRLAEFAAQMQGQQRLAWADNAIKLAVDMTVAAVSRVNVQGNAEDQAEQIRAVIARVFPEAVALVREAREGLQ